MPQIICDYCLYMGQGETMEEQWLDVERHEKDDCKEKPNCCIF